MCAMPYCVYICVILLALSACAVKVPPPPPSPAPSPPEITRTQYTIQAGAFSDVQNAIRLTRSLEEKGLCAYYFRDKDGLFKVRFGEFAKPSEALDRAESLLSEGIIDVFYIVSPESYPAAEAATDAAVLRSSLVETAERFLGIPYQWGGTSPDNGFDCSGLVMAVYQLNGFNLPRTSRDQFASGRPVDRRQLQKGDLVFFSFAKKGVVSHVGMYTGEDAFIHAPGRGKIIRKDILSTPAFATRFAGARTYLR
jgi:hypothetical protein